MCQEDTEGEIKREQTQEQRTEKDSMYELSAKNDRLMKDRLRNCILLLSADEQKLICRHYYDEISEVELSHEYGITQQAISKRLKKIRMKLKDMLE